MAHNRKLVLGGVALTQAKLPAKQAALAMGKARDELEQEIINSGYLNGAPFKWIGLIIREGLVDELIPHYKKIDQKDGELPLAIEVNTNRLIGVSAEVAKNIYLKAALLAVVHASERYDLDSSRMRELLADVKDLS
jgi:hypothetical protein